MACLYISDCFMCVTDVLRCATANIQSVSELSKNGLIILKTNDLNRIGNPSN